MATSPDIVGTGVGAEALRDAVFVIDTHGRALTVVLCNAAASRYFGGAAPAARLYGSPLHQLLAARAQGAARAAIGALSEARASVRRVIGWRRGGVETLLPTEFRLLESAPGERRVLLSFPTALPAPRAIGEELAEREKWERDILEAANRERQRIGCDLHDGVGQELTGVAFMLGALTKKIHLEYPQGAAAVDEITALLKRSIDGVRSLAKGMLPVTAAAGGLDTALRELAVRSAELYGIKVYFCAEVRPGLTLSDDHASHLYRIAQEALGNSARHGGAAVVDMLLVITQSTLLLRIADDGSGMQAGPHPGMGLRIMEYRAGILGATLEISANAPKGTVVRVISDAPHLKIRL